MTVFKICAIRDSKAEAWMVPMFFQANGQAVRSFGDAVRKSDSDFGRHPEDYNLYLVGEYDDMTGEILPCEPVHLIAGANVKEVK